MSVEIGQNLSHYHILEKLGGGGMGVVYKALDLKLDRFVALKFLPPSFSSDDEVKQRFIHEAKAASALEHNNICNIHEIDETEDSQLFIAMAFYQGETLKKKIERGPIAIEDAANIIIKIAEGLTKAHEKKIIHRDIKPANIFITDDDVVKILDFGLAKVTGQTELTQLGTTVGTVAYTSPEQARGEKIDRQTDVWSLGVVFYEMITGQKPFKGDYDQALVYTIINEEPEPPTSIKSGIPMEMERIINISLAKDPAERYQSIDDLLVDLRTLLKLSNVGRKTPVISTGNKKKRFIYVGIVLSIIIITAVIAYFSFQSDKNITSIAVLPLENISGDPEQEYFSDGMTDAIIGELGKINSLNVISRRSVMKYKGVYKSIIDIGNELDADAIVEGTVLNIGDQVRINIQLIDAKEDKNLWDGQYEVDLKNILKLQSNVSKEIAKEIRVKISPEEKSLMTITKAVNKDAYQLYLRALFYYNKATFSDYQKSIKLFNEAINLDSLFAEAYAGLSNSYTGLIDAKYIPADIGWSKVSIYAGEAMKLNPNLPSPYLNLAEMNIKYNWNWVEAEKQITSVLKLYPNDWFAHFIYAEYLASREQFESAVHHIEKALILNPLSANTHQLVSVLYRMMGMYNEAEKQLETAFELDSSYLMIPASYSKLYIAQRKYKKAIVAMNKAIELMGESSRIIRLAQCYAYLGMKDSAELIINRALKDDEMVRNRSLDIAIAHIALNDYDNALYWMEESFKIRSPELHWIKIDKRLDPIREYPRFHNILRKMNLE